MNTVHNVNSDGFPGLHISRCMESLLIGLFTTALAQGRVYDMFQSSCLKQDTRHRAQCATSNGNGVPWSSYLAISRS
jgi:hypothetical protein